jgi:hypothetical protein
MRSGPSVAQQGVESADPAERILSRAHDRTCVAGPESGGDRDIGGVAADGVAGKGQQGTHQQGTRSVNPSRLLRSTRMECEG